MTYWANDGKYQKEYTELHKKLIPPYGQCETTRGELLRSISNLYYDFYNNGGGNTEYGSYKKELDILRNCDKIDQSLVESVAINVISEENLEKLTDSIIEIVIDLNRRSG